MAKKEQVPAIRFQGFADPWEQRKLGDLMNVTSVKRIHQSDWTDSGIRFLRARDIVAAAKGSISLALGDVLQAHTHYKNAVTIYEAIYEDDSEIGRASCRERV